MAVPILHWRLLSNCRQCGWLYKWNIHPNWQACFLELKPPTYTVPINIVLDLFVFGCDCCGIESGDNTLYLTNNIYIYTYRYICIHCLFLFRYPLMNVGCISPRKILNSKREQTSKNPKITVKKSAVQSPRFRLRTGAAALTLAGRLFLCGGRVALWAPIWGMSYGDQKWVCEELLFFYEEITGVLEFCNANLLYDKNLGQNRIDYGV